MTDLPRSTPEAQGIAPDAVLAFVNAVNDIRDMHSFMLLRHGQVVAEGWWRPYAKDQIHELYSLTKSFTSTAIGFAVQEKLLALDDTVVSFFPESAPAKPSPNMAAMRIRHLLSMSTGHHQDATGPMRQNCDDWVGAFFSQEVQHEPGTRFVYNSAASHMLSEIIQKLTGQTLRRYLQPRLFEPLGINGEVWQATPRGVLTGGWGLSLKTEEIAKFGQFLLQGGVWNGRRLLEEKWIATAGAKHISNGTDPNSDWSQGYGFQFWRCRHNAWRGDGAFGQYCIMMPEQDAVLAITSGVSNMAAVTNAAWENLLPAMADRPLSPDKQATESLQQRLASLELEPLAGASTSDLAACISGRTWTFGENPLGIRSIRLEEANGRWLNCGIDQSGEHTASAGHRKWAITEGRDGVVAGSYGWTDARTLVLKYWRCNTPYSWTQTMRFEGDQVSLTCRQNVSFGPTEWPAISGKAR